jgi:SAM-dependent methyltransferase
VSGRSPTDLTPGEAYEAFLVPALFGPWARAVLARWPPAAGAHVLDVACGTGVAARLAARLVGPAGRVTALDLDEGMLAVARRAAPGARAAPIQWRQGDALALPFEAATFDSVLCFEGIQFFPQRPAGLAQIRRVLRPGGRLLATIWGALDANPAYAALAEGLRAFVSEAAACLPPFTLADPEEIRRLVTAAGFDRVGVTAETLTFTVPSAETFVDWVAAGAPTTRRALAQVPAGRRAEFGRLVAARLEPYRAERGLALPSVRHVVVAG